MLRPLFSKVAGRLLALTSELPGSGWLLDEVSVTPTRAVPDGGSTVSLLGFGLLGLFCLAAQVGLLRPILLEAKFRNRAANRRF
jgi:protein with PEP-CTERM/exosortase system signal